jgi:hypothetical protein
MTWTTRPTIPEHRRTLIGFYGCSNADRVVCVGGPRGKRGPDVIQLNRWMWEQECSACGEVHKFQPLWRVVNKSERKRKAEVTLTEANATIQAPRMITQTTKAGRERIAEGLEDD